MRSPLRGSYVAKSAEDTLPAPVGGWNARNPVAQMPRTDAIFLDNFWPTAADVSQRKGSLTFATLPDDDYPADEHNVRSLMAYNAPDGTGKFFAGCEDGIYDITAGGTVTTPDSVCTDGRWLSVNITTAGGSFLWCCNGVDAARYYNGTAWTVLDNSSLTGVAADDVAHVSLHKFRLMLCANDYLGFYYLGLNSISGTATAFPLNAIFRRGGYVVATGTWTLDGGNGPDDYFVAITSEGEVAIYAGTDPSNANTWALVGVYFIGAPIGRNCLLKMGGDLVVITVQGLYPLSKSLLLSASDRRVAISDKIINAWTFYTSRFKSLFGWQAVLFAEEAMLLVNVPILQDHEYEAGVISYQFAMNTQTKAWCRFFGWSSEVWGTFQGKLYFACNNRVVQAWVGTRDDNAAIDSRGKQAYFYPGGKSGNKHIKLIQPLVTGSPNIPYQFGIDTDYKEGFLPAATAGVTDIPVGVWDDASWDAATWGSYNITQTSWRTASHMPGKAVSFRLRVNRKDANMSWIATDFITQKGGLL